MTETSCRQNIPQYESHCMKKNPNIWKQNGDYFRELNTNNHKGVCTKRKTHRQQQSKTAQAFWVAWLRSFPTHHWYEYPILKNSGPSPSLQSHPAHHQWSYRACQSHPYTNLHILTHPYTSLHTLTHAPVSPHMPPGGCSCQCAALLALPEWAFVVLCLSYSPGKGLLRFQTVQQLLLYTYYDLCVSPLTLTVIHCEIHSGQAPEALFPSLWGSERPHAVTRDWDCVMQKPRSPCIKLKPFSACSVTENNITSLPLEAEPESRGSRPSALLSIDGSKQLLLPQRRGGSGSRREQLPGRPRTPGFTAWAQTRAAEVSLQ